MRSITDATTKLPSQNSSLESYVIQKWSCVVWRGQLEKYPQGQLAGRLLYFKHGSKAEPERWLPGLG